MGGGRGNSNVLRALTSGSEYTLEISVIGEGVSVSEKYAINAPDGKNPQVFAVDDLPSETSVSVNVSVLCDGDILWMTKNVPTVFLLPGDNFLNIEMTKVQPTPLTPDDPNKDDPNKDNPNPEKSLASRFTAVFQNGGKEGQASVQGSAENPAEAVFTNKDVKDLLSIWDYHLDMKNPFDFVSGKNYRLSIEMKADKDTYAFLEAKNEASSYSGSQTFCNVGTEYKTFSVVTGNISESWNVDRFKIACGTAEKLYVRNFTVEETDENQNFVFAPWCGTASGYECIYPEEISATDVKVTFRNADETKNPGINIIPIKSPLDVDSIYRLSFSITSSTELKPYKVNESDESTVKPVEIWAHGISNDFETAGSNNFSFDANVPKNIVLYVVSYQNENEAFHIPQLWIRARKDCVLTVSGIKWEKTTVEEIKTENQSLDLYFAGEIDGGWTGCIPNSKSVKISKNTEGNGQFLLCDSNGWNSTENATTSFRILEEGAGAFINASVKNIDNDRRIGFENSTDKDIYVKFSLNSKNQVVIERAEEPLPLEKPPLYLVGSFNGWSESFEDKNFSLNDSNKKSDDGNGTVEYTFDFPFYSKVNESMGGTADSVAFKLASYDWDYEYCGSSSSAGSEYVMFSYQKEAGSYYDMVTDLPVEEGLDIGGNSTISGFQDNYMYRLSIKIDSEGKAYFKAVETGRAEVLSLSRISAFYIVNQGNTYPFTRQTGDPLALPPASDFIITEYYENLSGAGYSAQVTDGTGYSVLWKDGVDESFAIGNVPCLITKDDGSVSCEASVEVKYEKYVYGVSTQSQSYEAEKSSSPFRIGEEINPKTWQVWTFDSLAQKSSYAEKTDTLKFRWFEVKNTGNQEIPGNNFGYYDADVSAEGETKYRRLFSIETPADSSFYAGDTNSVSTDFTVTVKTVVAFDSASFSIPSVRINKKNRSVTASISGKNFKGSGVSENSFSVICPTDSSLGTNASVSVISDTELSLILQVPQNPADYTVRITSGSNYSEGVFSVKDYSDWKSGNIILADGSTVEPVNYTSIDASNPPVAVAIDGSLYYNQNEERFGVGLKTTSGQDWAKNNTTGFTTSFTDIVCTPSSDGNGAAVSATFEGDTDGSDNWNFICSTDSVGTGDPATNYPAFDWVNSYGTTYTNILSGGAIGICLALRSYVMFTDAKML